MRLPASVHFAPKSAKQQMAGEREAIYLGLQLQWDKDRRDLAALFEKSNYAKLRTSSIQTDIV